MVNIEQDGLELAPRLPSREEIAPWLEIAQGVRLNADVLGHLMPPRMGSFLRPTADDPLRKMAWWCHGFLEAAADHLMMWADYTVPFEVHRQATVHTLRPTFTLARAAIEAAAQVFWALSPEESAVRGRRFLHLVAWDVDEQAKAAGPGDAQAQIHVQRAQILALFGWTPRTFKPPRYVDMIRGVAEFLQRDDPDFPITPDGAERVWRSTAGAAHGKQWPLFEFEHHVEVAEGLLSSTPRIDAISEVLTVAEKYFSAAVVLFAMRAGHEEQLDQLWDQAAERLMQRLPS